MCECRLWLHIGLPSTLFSTSEMQNSWADLNQESTEEMVKSFAWTTRCSRWSVVNACGTNLACSFSFFKRSDRMRWMMVFGIPIHSTITLQLACRSSFKIAATGAMYLLFPAFRFALCLQLTPQPPQTGYVNKIPLCTLLCVFNRLLGRRKPAMSSKYHSTQHGRVIKHFYKHFPHFRSRKSHFTTKFYRGTLF